ncbi:hypothetical protein Tco_0345282, partial [Tanacetum coccineum]
YEYGSEDDDENDLWFMMKAIKMCEIMQQEGGSSRTQTLVYREYDDAEAYLMRDYFGEHPKYLEYKFRFCDLIRQLAYDTTPDGFDVYLHLGEHTAHDCLDNFDKCIIDLYMPGFLRKPDYSDIQNLYAAHNTVHGFLGILRSIDCMKT